MKFKPWKPREAMRIELGEQSKLFLAVTGLIGPAYARHVLRLDRIRVEGKERLVEEYRRSAADEGRFIVAYRHPGDADPHLVFHVLTNLLRGEAAATAADGRPGAWYPSGSEVQLWASPLVLWALKNAGIVPVRHGAVDRAVLDYLVKSVAERRRPMAIAPEGQTTFHRDGLFELDPGTARIAYLAAERLQASGKHIPLHILPVAIDYSYANTTPERLGLFISRLERRVGNLAPGSGAGGAGGRGSGGKADAASLKARLLALWEGLVTASEAAYARSWGIKAAPGDAGLRERLLALVDASIARLEGYYGVTPGPSLKSRILNIRAEALRRVFYSKEELAAFSPIGLEAARRGAAEAYFLDQVYHFAALAQFLDPAYIEGEESYDRLVETAQNLHDLANRLEGMGIGDRSHFFRKDATIVVGEPIEVGRREGEGRRESVERIQSELEAGFGALVIWKAAAKRGRGGSPS